MIRSSYGDPVTGRRQGPIYAIAHRLSCETRSPDRVSQYPWPDWAAPAQQDKRSQSGGGVSPSRASPVLSTRGQPAEARSVPGYHRLGNGKYEGAGLIGWLSPSLRLAQRAYALRGLKIAGPLTVDALLPFPRSDDDIPLVSDVTAGECPTAQRTETPARVVASPEPTARMIRTVPPVCHEPCPPESTRTPHQHNSLIL